MALWAENLHRSAESFYPMGYMHCMLIDKLPLCPGEEKDCWIHQLLHHSASKTSLRSGYSESLQSYALWHKDFNF